MCRELQIAAGLCSHEHLLDGPFLPGFRIARHLGRCKAVELEIIGGMDRDQLTLQVSRELGQLEAQPLQHAEDLIAIVLALGSQLEIEEPLIPGGNLYALEAQSRSPLGNGFQFIERLLVAGKLGQEDSGPLNGFHSWTHPARFLVTARSTKVMLRNPSSMPGTKSLKGAAGLLKRARTALPKSR